MIARPQDIPGPQVTPPAAPDVAQLNHDIARAIAALCDAMHYFSRVRSATPTDLNLPVLMQHLTTAAEHIPSASWAALFNDNHVGYSELAERLIGTFNMEAPRR